MVNVHCRLCAGLGRRSLLPSIPEAILSSENAAEMAAKRAALLATISPEVLLLPVTRYMPCRLSRCLPLLPGGCELGHAGCTLAVAI